MSLAYFTLVWISLSPLLLLGNPFSNEDFLAFLIYVRNLLLGKQAIWPPMADNQSNEELKKGKLEIRHRISVSSKLLLFLSLQMHHIKQGGIIIQI